MDKKINITFSEVMKKHLKVIGYLVISAVLAYILSVLTNKPEAVYLTPVINYILFLVKNELDKEGVLQVLKQK